MPLLVGRLLVVAAAASAKFSATFEGDSTAPFVESTNDRYANQDVGIVDGALMLKEPNRMYGVAAEIKPPFKLDDKLVIQYESTLTDGLTCGGAYVKLLESPVDTSKFDNESPYVLMFGPDRCGATDKVHFIVRQKNPKSNTWYEHHLRDAPRAKADRSPHLYKAVINSDDTFAIYIDDEEAFSGSLMDALEPPLTPPKEIDDPDDSKPKDWVDAAKIDDPEASKPDDWDEDAPREIDDATATMPAGWLEDEPLLIPDPSAEAPDDWDDEEDGEWEAPVWMPCPFTRRVASRRWRRGGWRVSREWRVASMAYDPCRRRHAVPPPATPRRGVAWRDGPRVRVEHTATPSPRLTRLPPTAGDRQPQVRQGAGLRPVVAAEDRQPRLQGQVVPAADRQP